MPSEADKQRASKPEHKRDSDASNYELREIAPGFYEEVHIDELVEELRRKKEKSWRRPS